MASRLFSLSYLIEQTVSLAYYSPLYNTLLNNLSNFPTTFLFKTATQLSTNFPFLWLVIHIAVGRSVLLSCFVDYEEQNSYFPPDLSDLPTI